MPTSSGPNLLGDSNIIFHYDVDDVINSYKGEPTVNLLYSSGAVNLTNGASDIYGRCTKTDLGGGKYRFTNNGTGSSTVRLYTNQPDLINGGTYGCSIYYENLIGALSFDWCDTSVTGVNSNTGQSGRLYGYGSRGSYASPYYFLDVNFDSGGAVTLYNPQVEYKSYVTPFVGGTRSSTQGLIPLVGTSAIDLTNVSFDSNSKITLDGTNDYLFVPTNTTLQPPTALTLESVFKVNSYTNGNFIISYAGDATGSYVKYGFRLLTSGGVTAYINSTGAVASTSSNVSIVSGAWVHAVLTYDGASVKIYINGVFRNSTSQTGIMDYTTYGSPYYLNIGRKNNEGGYTNGSVNLVKIYNRILTTNEVINNYLQYKTRFNLS